jgi:hypothetical protein
MCRVGIVDYSVSGGCRRCRDSEARMYAKARRGEWRKEERMEEKSRKIAGGEKGKWGKRGPSRLIFGQRGGGRQVILDCSTKKGERK